MLFPKPLIISPGLPCSSAFPRTCRTLSACSPGDWCSSGSLGFVCPQREHPSNATFPAHHPLRVHFISLHSFYHHLAPHGILVLSYLPVSPHSNVSFCGADSVVCWNAWHRHLASHDCLNELRKMAVWTLHTWQVCTLCVRALWAGGLRVLGRRMGSEETFGVVLAWAEEGCPIGTSAVDLWRLASGAEEGLCAGSCACGGGGEPEVCVTLSGLWLRGW